MTTKGFLYLIPNVLAENTAGNVIAPEVQKAIANIKHFIVEDEKIARRFLKSIQYPLSLNELELYPMHRHAAVESKLQYLQACEDGLPMGIISDAGCPGIADPGAEFVAMAHKKGIKVIPLVGPSSILLSLMASGLNGQHFCFNGYLPKERTDRIKKLKNMAFLVRQQNQTQLFIETPFRNDHLLEDLLQQLDADIKLCIAANITASDEIITTKTIAEWKLKKPVLGKKQIIFLIGN